MKSDKVGGDGEASTKSELEQLFDNWENIKIDTREGLQALKCDRCDAPIAHSSSPTTYSSTGELNDSISLPDEALMLQNIYCEKCQINSVRVPCEGILEIVCKNSLTRDHRLADFTVIDYSLRSDGIPWNPREVLNDHFGPAFYEMILEKKARKTTSYDDVINFLNFYGIDPRDIIDDDGSTNMDPERRDESMQKVREIQDKEETRSEISERLQS